MSYEIDLDGLRVEEDEITRDNIRALSDALEKIKLVLDDIDERLKAGGL